MAPVSAAPPVFVSLTFDNNTSSQYTLGFQQALQPHGVGATYYVSSGTVGVGPGLHDLGPALGPPQAAGAEIGGDHPLHRPDRRAGPDGDRRGLRRSSDAPPHGLNATSFAYPYGAFNQAAKDIVTSCGYGSARGAGGLSPAGPTFAESVPPADRRSSPRTRRRVDQRCGSPVARERRLSPGVVGHGRDPERLLADPRPAATTPSCRSSAGTSSSPTSTPSSTGWPQPDNRPALRPMPSCGRCAP